METELMTIRDVARLLRLNDKAVGRLAETGELPGLKVARSWRFSRTAVAAWQARAGKTDAPVAPVKPALTLAGVMDAGRMNLKLRGADKDTILHELVALVIDPGRDRDAEIFFQALKAREDLCSTCVNDGVAIPHARNALVGLVNEPLLAYGRHAHGVDFGALDGQPVQHFFLLCAPNVRDHLQLLARLSRLLHAPDFRTRLQGAATPDAVIALIASAEENLPVVAR